MEHRCKYCRNKVKVAPYFFNERIKVIINPLTIPNKEFYTVKVDFKYVCPYCGEETIDFKEKDLKKEDIVNLVF